MTPQNTLTQLQDWLAWRDLSRAEVEDKFNIAADMVQTDTSYVRVGGLDMLRNHAVDKGRFYFRGTEFVVYVLESVGKGPNTIPSDESLQSLGEAAAVLPARVGKRSKVHIYPEKGIALSVLDNTIRLLEIFPPMSLQAYKDSFYYEPDPYIR
jgi:hypothetical protein